jgi:MOSC domain-containing protein YiiM
MRVLSVNVGRPQLIMAQGVAVSSGIVKRPVNVPVMVRLTNLDGDRQSDLSVHGGPNKAVYGYPSEYYPLWRHELANPELSYGGFGENLTTEGLLDHKVVIGDRYQVGEAVLLVTQPRMPCFKLTARLGQEAGRIMIETKRHGFYFSVEQEGLVSAGDEIRLLERPKASLTVVELASVYLGHAIDPELLRRAMAMETLSEKWKNKLAQRAGL